MDHVWLLEIYSESFKAWEPLINKVYVTREDARLGIKSGYFKKCRKIRPVKYVKEKSNA